MRKIILTVLLGASAAMPAVAQDRDFGGRQRDHGAQQAPNEQRDESSEARHAERPEQVQQEQQVERERPSVAERANWSDRGAERQRAVEQQAAQEPDMQQRVVERGQDERQRGDRSNWDQRRGDNMRASRDPQRLPSAAPYAEDGQVLSQQRDIRRVRDGSILGQRTEQDRERQGQVALHRDRDRVYSGTNQWNNHWRGDRNYDWRHYRDRNRSVFRLGNYWDPYGSRYRRFSIGFSLFPSYYQSNYWLDDPWMYRLPTAYGPYRWVRYYDDALLVNVYTGQVVDVVYSFFW